METKIRKYLTEEKMSSSESGKAIGQSTKDVKKILDDYYRKHESKYGEVEALKIQWSIYDSLVRDLQKKQDLVKRELTKKGEDPMSGF